MSQDELKHYGIKRHSGRYPWGSGRDPYQRSMSFYALVDDLKAKGVPDTDIAKLIGDQVREITGNPRDKFTTADLRSTRTIAKEQIVLEQTRRAVSLRDKGVSIQKIAEQLDLPQPTVRLRLKNSEKFKQSALAATAEVIRKNVDKYGIVDVGKGTELHLGIADTRLNAALGVLRDEGYETYAIKIHNVGTRNMRTVQVVVPPGTGFGGANKLRDKIHTMGDYTENDGLTYFGIHEPMNVSSKRLKVNYAEDGGTDADGVVYVRPGVKDLSMGKNTYAQVRIAIDGTHYIKGMAVLNPDLPPGVDLLFNTNKSKNDPKVVSEGKLGALKPLKTNPDGTIDKDNPFGSMLKRQIVDTDPKTGAERLVSAMNIVNEEGDWQGWRKSLPSQMLAKQPHSLIKSQLVATRQQTADRLADIEKITNPVIRQKKLQDFAEQIDSDAVDLRAAQMPRQQTKVIIPVPKISKNEVYAPGFETGDRVALIRYPHGGRFEIPEVIVNNNSRTAKRLLGNATDAIGIHPSVAERLSGADFDGDTVTVIPNPTGKIKGISSLGNSAKYYEEQLATFDPKRKYGGYEVVKPAVGKPGDPGYKPEVGNYRIMKNTGKEMGVITNLITDMSIQGAKPEHVVKAVRHSMVVIDAEKHKLDYKQSEIDNSIQQLKELYQARPGEPGKFGASTLLSRATAKQVINERKPRPAPLGGAIDKETGEKVYVETGRTISKYDPKTQTYDPNVKVRVTEKEKGLALTKDARDLVRDPSHPVESLYADHANAMKALANQARLRADRIPSPKMNPKAKEVYGPELARLVDDLNAAKKLKPLERRADVIARGIVKQRRVDDPTLRTDPDRLKKVERQAKAYALERMGLKKPVIEITDRQWDAIQSGAVSASRLRQILDYADPKRIEELSIPKPNAVMTTAITARARAMLAAGATNADVARALGIPPSTLRAAALRGEV